MQKELNAGVGRVEITPEIGTRLMGYPIKDRVAESIHDPLYATALMLDNGELKAIIISLDSTIIQDKEVNKIQKLIGKKIDVKPENIIISSIQTHSGPATQTCWGWGEKDEEYLNQTFPKIVEAAVKAEQQLKPVKVGIGTTSSEVGVNRREILPDHSVGLGVNPWGPYDHAMTVLKFVGESGPLANIVNYGAHPTSAGHNTEVTRDWPGVMIDHMEDLTGATTMFINGAVGDVGPRLSCGGTTGNGLDSVYEVGYQAGRDAIKAYNSIKEYRELTLDVINEEILLPYRPLPSLEKAEKKMKESELGKDEWGAPRRDYMYWKAVVEAHEKPAKKGKQFSQTIVRLGPVALIPFPGEPFAAIDLRLRRHSPFAHTLTASTTNGACGYFPTRESLHRGGYEVEVAKAFGAYLMVENIDDILVEENLKLLDKLHNA